MQRSGRDGAEKGFASEKYEVSGISVQRSGREGPGIGFAVGNCRNFRQIVQRSGCGGAEKGFAAAVGMLRVSIRWYVWSSQVTCGDVVIERNEPALQKQESAHSYHLSRSCREDVVIISFLCMGFRPCHRS